MWNSIRAWELIVQISRNMYRIFGIKTLFWEIIIITKISQSIRFKGRKKNVCGLIWNKFHQTGHRMTTNSMMFPFHYCFFVWFWMPSHQRSNSNMDHYVCKDNWHMPVVKSKEDVCQEVCGHLHTISHTYVCMEDLQRQTMEEIEMHCLKLWE